MAHNETNTVGISKLAFLAVGGYLLWKNRFKIQEMLETQGVKTPWLNSDIGEAVQSGAAKLSGKTRRSVENDSAFI